MMRAHTYSIYFFEASLSTSKPSKYEWMNEWKNAWSLSLSLSCTITQYTKVNLVVKLLQTYNFDTYDVAATVSCLADCACLIQLIVLHTLHKHCQSNRFNPHFVSLPIYRFRSFVRSFSLTLSFPFIHKII